MGVMSQHTHMKTSPQLQQSFSEAKAGSQTENWARNFLAVAAEDARKLLETACHFAEGLVLTPS